MAPRRAHIARAESPLYRSAVRLLLVVATLMLGGTAHGLGAQSLNADSAPTVEIPSRSLADLVAGAWPLRLESTAPEFGWTSIRFPGQSGQHTRVLIDGLPLLDGAYGGLSPDAIPALDLERIEVIAGPASARFGAAGFAGVINLVSRPLGGRPVLLVSTSSKAGAEAQAFVYHPLAKRTTAGLFASAHAQPQRDVDGDGWADVAEDQRLLLRPRLAWTGSSGQSMSLVSTLAFERSIGGPRKGSVPAGTTDAFEIGNEAAQVGGGLTLSWPTGLHDTVQVRGSASGRWGRQRFDPSTTPGEERGRHHILYGEATLSLPRGRTGWLVGFTLGQDAFRSRSLEGFNFSDNTAGLFARASTRLGRVLDLEAEARCDWYHRYGTFCTPRASVAWSSAAKWSARLAAAIGVSAPTPFTDETEGVPWARLVPFAQRTIAICDATLCDSDSGAVALTAPLDRRPERSRFASFEVHRQIGTVAVSAAAFAMTVDHRLVLWDLNIFEEQPQLLNAAGPKRTLAARLAATYHGGTVVASADYQFLASTLVYRSENDRIDSENDRIDAPLTPRHSAAVAMSWTPRRWGTTLHVWGAYTGRQTVLENPYRSVTPSFVEVHMGVAHRVGAATWFVIGENLGDMRQTRRDPLLKPVPGATGRWTTDVWAPLAGRALRVGLRTTLPRP
jgi:iron complex outermembrane receptor protein